MQRFKTDPAYGQETMTRVKGYFDAADADGDGRLNREEYVAYMNKIKEWDIEHNVWTDYPDEFFTRMYDLYNELSGGEEGFTWEMHTGCHRHMQGAFMKICAEQGDIYAWALLLYKTLIRQGDLSVFPLSYLI